MEKMPLMEKIMEMLDAVRMIASSGSAATMLY
jgi:hypothetical protein